MIEGNAKRLYIIKDGKRMNFKMKEWEAWKAYCDLLNEQGASFTFGVSNG